MYQKLKFRGPLYSMLLPKSLFLVIGIGSSSLLFKAHASASPSLLNVNTFQQDSVMWLEGRVFNERTQQPIAGVTVALANGKQVGNTDETGRFKVQVPRSATLQFSFVGFKKLTFKPAGEKENRIFLHPDQEDLDEVVVVGYGTQRKSDLTGAVGSVKEEALRERPAASLNQALAGRVTGVNVSTNSGRPGGNTNVRIRGNTSISVTNNPLYVVDGVILNVSSLANGSTPIDYLNANDIASLEVLKDASATAIYGARGANGVILISTKKGTGLGPRLTYDNDLNVGVLPKKLKLLNAAQFLAIEDLQYMNAEKFDPDGWAAGKYQDPKLKRTNPLLFDGNGKPLYDTDWQDETYQKAFSQNHQLSITGGNDKDTYGAFMGYRHDNGLIRESRLKRYSGRVYFDSQLRDWWKIGASISYNDQRENQVDDLGHGGITVMRQIIEALPIIPVRYPDGKWAGNANYPGMEGGNNPLQLLSDRLFHLNTQTVLGNFYSTIRLAKGLELRTVVGANVINQRTDSYSGRELIWISADAKGVASINSNKNESYQFENYLTYTNRFQDHSVNAMLGLSTQYVKNFNFNASTQNFADDFFTYNNLGVGATPRPPGSTTNAYGLNSYFSRINYGYMDRYLVTFTGRVDGSSKFGAANRYAFFPSAAVAWKASEESFIKDLAVFSNLKLRSSIGYTGNSEIAAYQALAGLGNYSAIFDRQRVSGIGLQRLANPDLKWEKTEQMDIGLEMGFFGNRLVVEADIYRKRTRDMLLGAPVPATSGFTSMIQNIGSMENKGLELTFHTQNIKKENFSWNTSFNISLNKNKVLALGAANDDIFPGPSVLAQTNVIRVGEPVGSFYGYERLGTWQEHEAAEASRYNKKPGDLKLKDVNGDGQINDRDRVILGKGIPDGFGTLINTFKYKNIDFAFEIQYSYGNDVLDISKHSAEDRQGQANSYATVLDAWTPTNQATAIAQVRPVSAGYTTNIDSHFVEDGSFIRGRNLLVGYNFTDAKTKAVGLKSLRVFASVQNFFLLTKYSGYDPEVSNFNQTFAQGITVFGYPKPRTFMFGINASF